MTKGTDMERKETIVYGGAFNPPTLAHQAILQACIHYAEPRKADVWLLPSASRLDKTIETSNDRRLRLCEALICDVVQRSVKLKINSSELDRNEPTQTYETVKEFQVTYPDRTFRWVFGADSVAHMPTWRGGEWMRENLPMLVVGRPGSPHIKGGANIIRLAVESPISSTEVRRRMASNESYEELVGPHVGAILAESNVSN